MKLVWKMLAAVLAVTLIAAGCGDDDVDQDAVDEVLDDGGDDAGDDDAGDDDAGDDDPGDDTGGDDTAGDDDTGDDTGGDDTAGDDDSGDDTGDDDSGDDTGGDDTAADDDGAEPEPATPVATDNCVILRHYANEGVFEAPYFVTVTTAIDITEDDDVMVVMPDGTEFLHNVWPTDADGPGRIDVDFPVFGPGEVVLPEVWVNGEQLPLADDFWGRCV